MSPASLAQAVAPNVVSVQLPKDVGDAVLEVALVPNRADPCAFETLRQGEQLVAGQLDPAHGLSNNDAIAHEEGVQVSVDNAVGDEPGWHSVAEHGSDGGAQL